MTTQEALKSILPTEYLDIFLERELTSFIENFSNKLENHLTPEVIISQKWTKEFLALLPPTISRSRESLIWTRTKYLFDYPTISSETAFKLLCQSLKVKSPIYLTEYSNNNKLLVEKFKGNVYHFRGSGNSPGTINWIHPGHLLGRTIYLTNTIKQEWTKTEETNGDTHIHYLEVVCYHFSGYTYRKTTYLFKLGELYGGIIKTLTTKSGSTAAVEIASIFYSLRSSSLFIYPIKDHFDPTYASSLEKVIGMEAAEKRKEATISSVLADFVERYYFQVSDSKAFIVCYNCNQNVASMAIEAELISLTSIILDDART